MRTPAERSPLTKASIGSVAGAGEFVVPAIESDRSLAFHLAVAFGVVRKCSSSPLLPPNVFPEERFVDLLRGDSFFRLVGQVVDPRVQLLVHGFGSS